MNFGARLKEERRRLGLKQVEFAALVGTDMPKQSLYERGHRQLRADYLSRIAPVGIDILYVITGRRRGESLGEEATTFLGTYLALPPELREPVEQLMGDLTGFVEQGSKQGG
ncbi:MAG TPA: helix-turn-helix transcriptional regulator [Allosphingosinicella sp.]|jgi:transcriptional regulator with XRE-family HTH domain